jgi:hypothetical protein
MLSRLSMLLRNLLASTLVRDGYAATRGPLRARHPRQVEYLLTLMEKV